VHVQIVTKICWLNFNLEHLLYKFSCVCTFRTLLDRSAEQLDIGMVVQPNQLILIYFQSVRRFICKSPFRLHPSADIFGSDDDAFERAIRRYEEACVKNRTFDGLLKDFNELKYRFRLMAYRVSHLEALVGQPERLSPPEWEWHQSWMFCFCVWFDYCNKKFPLIRLHARFISYNGHSLSVMGVIVLITDATHILSWIHGRKLQMGGAYKGVWSCW